MVISMYTQTLTQTNIGRVSLPPAQVMLSMTAAALINAHASPVGEMESVSVPSGEH